MPHRVERVLWIPKRFKNPIKALQDKKPSSSVKEIVRDAIKATSATRRGTDLHAPANMVYWNDDREFQELTATQTVIYTNVPVNTDYNIMDCYV